MTGLTKLPAMFLLALGLTAAGCGDDKKDDPGTPMGDGDVTEDAGPVGDGDGDVDAGPVTGDPMCKAMGLYDGHKFSELKAKLAAAGECRADAQVAEICTTNPSDTAGTAGRACLSFTGPTFEECVAKGIKDVHPLSDSCIDCFVQSVVCSRTNCLGQCADATKVEECAQCRLEKGCTPAFFTCSGLPAPDTL